MKTMQNRITKSCQIKKSKRADRLRDLLQLTAADQILLDACARKPFNEGMYKSGFISFLATHPLTTLYSTRFIGSFTDIKSRYDTR